MSSGFELRTLGSTGIQVTPLGMSATYMPGRKTVYAAFDEGINLFFAFGIDRQMIHAVRELVPSNRDKIVLVTGAYNFVWRAQDIRKAFEKRLRSSGQTTSMSSCFWE